MFRNYHMVGSKGVAIHTHMSIFSWGQGGTYTHANVASLKKSSERTIKRVLKVTRKIPERSITERLNTLFFMSGSWELLKEGQQDENMSVSLAAHLPIRKVSSKIVSRKITTSNMLSCFQAANHMLHWWCHGMEESQQIFAPEKVAMGGRGFRTTQEVPGRLPIFFKEVSFPCRDTLPPSARNVYVYTHTHIYI